MVTEQRSLGATSMKRRLMLGFLVTTGLALTLASTAYFLTELYKVRAGMVNHITVMASVIGENIATSLLFANMADADKTIVTLEVHEHVMASILYDDRGEVFASYLRSDVNDLPEPSRLDSGHVFRDGVLDIFQPVTLEGDRLGTVFIRSDTGELRELFMTFLLIFVVVTLGSLAVCYLGAAMICRQITTPLGALVHGSSRMAEGDLSVEVEVVARDELGTLATTFNGMVKSLRGLVSQAIRNTRSVADVSGTLRDASDSLSSEMARQELAVEGTAESIERINVSIGEVNGNIETLSHTATSTSAAVTQMDASIGETAGHIDGLSESMEDTASAVVAMTGAIREIARNADQLNSSTESTAAALDLLSSAVKQVEGNAQESHALSEKTAEQAELGMRSVQKTVEGMHGIQLSFSDLERIISDLSEKSESIGEVVKVIESVVEQTNLLALNAAIISSQAGEHGRAFAVVAEEVKSLAERTAGSTREISELIAAVQTSVGGAVEAMSQSGKRVEDGVSLSRGAGEILRVIGESARESSQRIHEIVEAAEHQTLDIGKVAGAMSQAKTIAAQLNSGTHEQDSAGADITRSVERMRDLGQQVKQSTQEQSKESRLISQSAEVVAARINQILEATNEQSAQGAQILQALQVFREVTHQSKRRGEEIRTGLEELSERSRILEEEIGRFQL